MKGRLYKVPATAGWDVGRKVVTMEKLTKDEFVLVRGGVSGAGRNISLKVAKEGYNVFANTADSAHNYRGDILIDECAALGVKFAYDSGDPAVYENAQQIVNDAEAVFGGRMVAYINNDGIVDGGRLPSYTFEQYKELLDMHILTMLNCAKTAAEYMARNGGGQFINVVACMAPPWEEGERDFSFEVDLYRAFTKSLAKTYAPQNVRFNTIISVPLAYPPDPQLEPMEMPKEMERALHFGEPKMSTESPDEFMDLLLKVIQSPGMTGQTFSQDMLI